jgi:hypothetical protein
MRRCLVIFMLLLLPIRGWVGDAMAYSMLPTGQSPAHTAAQNATHSGAAYAHIQRAGIDIDHQNPLPTTAAHPCHTDLAAADDSDSTPSQCNSCQVCHLSAATPLQLPSGTLHTSAALPAQRAAPWTSADPRLLAKTPVV